ncbi:VOC family protein [Nocardioides sp. LHG3406-4]|uniref:VOC family protein n=1 Tax=Nocardioides sp. LHG3406-4 TaxID=2804575 RepID=UPI003CED515A
MTFVDHLLVSVSDPGRARERWSRAGLTATVGGEHPGGTSNSLVRGPRAAFVELITAAPDATSEAGRRVLETSGPFSWALRVTDMEKVRAAVVAAGFDAGDIHDGSRTTPAGDVIRWRICDLAPIPLHPYIPFLIEWETPMPAGPADGPVLVAVTLECPDPQGLGALLAHAGLPPAEGGAHVFDDGDVVVTLAPGDGGVRVAELAVPDGPQPDIELDGLLVRRVAR